MRVTLSPEGVESKVLQIDVRREALAGVGDGAVPRAAAEVAGDGALRLGRGEPGEALPRRRARPVALALGAGQRGGEGHAHPGRAESALRGVEAREARVHGVEPVPAAPEPLGGGDRAVVEAVRQGEAGGRGGVRHLVRRRVVRREQHRARAAPAFAAAELGAGEAGSGAEEVEEGGARVVAVAELEALAVDREHHRHGAGGGARMRCEYQNPVPIPCVIGFLI